MLITSVSWTFWASPCKNLGPIKVLRRIFFSRCPAWLWEGVPGSVQPPRPLPHCRGLPGLCPCGGAGSWLLARIAVRLPRPLCASWHVCTWVARGEYTLKSVHTHSQDTLLQPLPPPSGPSGLRDGLPLGGDCAVHIQLCQISGWPQVGAGGRGQETWPALPHPACAPQVASLAQACSQSP